MHSLHVFLRNASSLLQLSHSCVTRLHHYAVKLEIREYNRKLLGNITTKLKKKFSIEESTYGQLHYNSCLNTQSTNEYGQNYIKWIH
jgi:hypothetical protein